MKRKITNDNNGIAWFIALGIIAVIGAVGVASSYFIFQQPDITYNISDTGFSLAGLDIDFTWVILIIVGIVFLWLIFLSRRLELKFARNDTIILP